MSAFDTLNARAAAFAEENMGESFAYTSPGGTTTTGLLGVFNQQEAVYTFEDFSQRRETDLVCASSKSQWGATVPENRGVINYGSVDYSIDKVDATATAGDPWYTMRLRRLT